MSKVCFKHVSRKFQKVFQGYFKKESIGCFKTVSWGFKEGSKVFDGKIECVLKVFQGYFMSF